MHLEQYTCGKVFLLLAKLKIVLERNVFPLTSNSGWAILKGKKSKVLSVIAGD